MTTATAAATASGPRETLAAALRRLAHGEGWARGHYRQVEDGELRYCAIGAVDASASEDADGDAARRGASLVLARAHDPGARCEERCCLGHCEARDGLCVSCARRIVERANDGAESWAAVEDMFRRGLAALGGAMVP